MTSDRRFPIGLTVATAIALLILCGLGAWQLQRLAWKRAVLTHVAALRTAPAQSLDDVLSLAARGQDVDFTRVRAICKRIGTAPFLELYALRDGHIGSRLISACEVDSGPYRSILVDRGFVADIISARPPVQTGEQTDLVAASATIGVLRKPDHGNAFSPPNTPDRWYTRDIPAMAAALEAPKPAPIMLMAETSSNPEWKALVPSPLPTEIPNRHLEYAITWFGLAGALVGVYAALLWRRWKA
jgi:surfeit locus 1 family protein